MPSRVRPLLWAIGAYVLLLVTSQIWRRLHPFEPTPRPDEIVLNVPRVTKDRTLGGSVRLAVIDRPAARGGTSTPVVLFHGSPGSNSEVSSLTELLSAERRAIAPDLPGFGASTRAIPDYSLRAHARYALAMLDSLGVERAHLLGFSMGGGVATNVADIAPDRVASITLLSAIGAQEYELLGNYLLNHAVHGIQLLGLWFIREAIPHFGVLDGTFLGVEYARNFYDSDQRPLRRLLNTVQAPVLIVQGERDGLVHPSVALEHHRIVPHSELVMLRGEGANHFMAFARPDTLAPIVADFLARVDQRVALTRGRATPDRLDAAGAPFDPATLPKPMGLTLAIVLLLIAAATFISEDLACIATGLLVGRGTLAFATGTAACFVGIVVGDLGLYVAGRWLGRPVIRRAPFRWLISDADIARSSAWFDRHGAWIALATRFVPGTRLPTYVTAGLLHTKALAFLAVFLLAALLWTPLLVGASAMFGSRVLATFTQYQRFALPTIFFTALVLYVIVKLVIPLATRRGRRLVISRWLRLTRWEYWPRWVVYAPMVPYLLWLAFKHRSLTVWTAANPAMPGGGFVGESKADILTGLRHSADRVAAWRLLPPGSLSDRVSTTRAFMADEGLAYPIVLKPDVGERGSGVSIVPDEASLAAYLESSREPVVAQAYVPGVELGVFYYRHPSQPRGQIFSITDKRFPTLVGDGVRTLEELILADSQLIAMARFHLARHAARLQSVPEDGEQVTVVELGTHSRGSRFYDGTSLRTPALERALDEVSRAYDGFFFGRYDLKGPSLEAIQSGRAFTVIELNGTGSEATSIYDPAHTLGDGLRILRRQWALVFAIGEENVRRGARATTVRELVGLLRLHRRTTRTRLTN